MASGGDDTPQGDPTENVPVYARFQGLKRTPVRNKGTRKPNTQSKRIHSPEEELKNKREKLLKPEVSARLSMKSPERMEHLPSNSIPDSSLSIKDKTGDELDETSVAIQQSEFGIGRTKTPLQELTIILDKLAQQAINSKTGTMMALITTAQAIVNTRQDRKTANT